MCRLGRGVFLGFAVGVFLGMPAQGAVARFPGVRTESSLSTLAIPEWTSSGGDVSEAGAVRRRLDLGKSPYFANAERRSLGWGGADMAADGNVRSAVKDAVAKAFSAIPAKLERAGLPSPFSESNHLLVLLSERRAGEALPGLVGWEGRAGTKLIRPVIAVDSTGRTPESVAAEVQHLTFILALRRAAGSVDESRSDGWLVEGIAGALTLDVLGFSGSAASRHPALQADAGSPRTPSTAAAFLAFCISRLPAGSADLRAAWEENNAKGDARPEAFFGEIARRSGLSLAALFAEALTEGTSIAGATDRGEPLADTVLVAPAALGFRRAAFRGSEEEQGGVELTLSGDATAGAIVEYQGPGGEYDAAPVPADRPLLLPVSGVSRLSLVLVGGSATEEGAPALRLSRIAGYPVSMGASSAAWADGAVQIAWRTRTHRDLLAFSVTRLSESRDGILTAESRELVPTSEVSESGFAYHFVDREALPGHRYYYRVHAITSAGVLSEAFAAWVSTER